MERTGSSAEIREEQTPKQENERKQFQNSWICTCTIFLSMASVMLSTGINGGTFNAVYGSLTTFFNTTHQSRHNGANISDAMTTTLLSLSGSIMLMGGFFGTTMSAFMLNKCGRSKCMIAMNMINLLATVITSLLPFVLHSYECFILGRFLFGFFSGVGMNLIPRLVHELSVPQKSTFLLSMIGVMISAGGLFGLFMGFNQILGAYDLKHILLSLSGIPSLVYLFCVRWMPDSPYTLIRDGRRPDAVSSLKVLHNGMDLHEINTALDEIEERLQMESKAKGATCVEMFTNPAYRRIMLVLLCVFGQVQLCGYVGVAMYTRMIVETADFSSSESIAATTIVFALEFVVAFVGSYFVDRYGPKRFNYMSSFIMAMSMTLLVISMYLAETMEVFKYISVVAVTAYVLSYSGGVSLTMFPLLISYSTEYTRTAGLAIGGGVFWILAWLVGFTFPYMLKSMNYFCYVPSIVFNLLFGFIFLLKMPETQGRSPEEITNIIQGITTKEINNKSCISSSV